MNNKRLVVVDFGFGTGEVFGSLFDSVIRTRRHSFELQVGDVLILEGGADINPALYDEEPLPTTGRPNYERDHLETTLFKQAVQKHIPVIGICRGAQLGCAMSGGKLVQHVDGHTVSHRVEDYKGRSFMVTSSHHQMMLPNKTEHKVLANAYVQSKNDPEVIWFEDTKCLAIQGHPEWAGNNSMFVQICKEYIKDFIQGNTK